MAANHVSARRSGTALVVLLVLIAAGIAFAGRAYYRDAFRRHRDLTEHQLSAIAELKVAELVDWREGLVSDGRVFFKNRSISALVGRLVAHGSDRSAQRQLLDWLGPYAGHQDYDEIRLLDPQGGTLLAVPDGRSAVSSVVLQRVPEVLRTGGVTLQDIYRSEHDQRVYLAVMVPILAESVASPPLGVLVIRVDPEVYLYPFINRWPAPSPTAETLILRKEGEDAVFLNELRFQPDPALNLRVPLSRTSIAGVQAVLGRQGVVDAIDYRGVQVVAALRAVPDSPWTLVARVDRAEVDAPMRDRFWQVVMVVGGLLLAAASSTGLVWRQWVLHAHREQAVVAAELRDSESRFLATFDQAAVGMAQVAPDGRYLRVNSRLCDILGYSAEELQQMTFQDITHPEDLDTDLALAREVLAGTRRTYAIEKRYIRKDRAIVWAALNVSLVRRASGDPAYFVSAVEDISEKRAAANEVRRLNAELDSRVVERTAQLEAANKELEAFSYSVSHDLRAPIRAISGYGRILSEDYADRLDAEGRRVLGVIASETRRAGQLVDDLLAFSRLGRQKMGASEIDMAALAAAVFEEQAARLPARALQLDLQPLPTSLGDPAMIRVVWDNLISNAIKFTQPRQPAVIEVGSRRQDGHVVYFVKDNGVGLDMAYAGKLFGVFQRLHSRDEFEGTGVGLALVQRIVNRHGGHVWAEGEVGHGAVFSFSLPDSRDAT